MTVQKYTKFLLALAGVVLPFLENVGIPLPEFLTLDSVQAAILAMTPALVYFFPNKDPNGPGAAVNSPPVVGFLAGLVAIAVLLSGCAGTAAAYRAADGLSETAYVIREHYDQIVVQLLEADRRGDLSPDVKSELQDMVAQTRGPIVRLDSVARAWYGVKTAETEAALTAALAEAAIVLADLSAAWDRVRSRTSSSLPPEIGELLPDNDGLLIFST